MVIGDLLSIQRYRPPKRLWAPIDWKSCMLFHVIKVIKIYAPISSEVSPQTHSNQRIIAAICSNIKQSDQTRWCGKCGGIGGW